DRVLGAAGELDAEVVAAPEERDHDRHQDHEGGDRVPDAPEADELDRPGARVEVVAEAGEARHQSRSSSMVAIVPVRVPAACCALRSAIVCLRTASPRLRSAGPVTATGARKLPRPRYTAPSARG